MKIARLEQSRSKIFVEIPLTEQSDKAQQKEKAHLVLDSTHKQFLLESFKIFGILSPNHNHDMREILKIIKTQI